jgi:hypothetical protein
VAQQERKWNLHPTIVINWILPTTRMNWGWALVAHACNPTYLGGRDQEDRSSKPAQANSARDPISKNPSQKIGLVEWLKVKARVQAPVPQKKKNKTSPLQSRCSKA